MKTPFDVAIQMLKSGECPPDTNCPTLGEEAAGTDIECFACWREHCEEKARGDSDEG